MLKTINTQARLSDATPPVPTMSCWPPVGAMRQFGRDAALAARCAR
jgi:hypothetical protein